MQKAEGQHRCPLFRYTVVARYPGSCDCQSVFL